MRAEAGEAGIEYEVTGDGRPVILLHGFPDSGRLWRNQVPVLAGELEVLDSALRPASPCSGTQSRWLIRNDRHR